MEAAASPPRQRETTATRGGRQRDLRRRRRGDYPGSDPSLRRQAEVEFERELADAELELYVEREVERELQVLSDELLARRMQSQEGGGGRVSPRRSRRPRVTRGYPPLSYAVYQLPMSVDPSPPEPRLGLLSRLELCSLAEALVCSATSSTSTSTKTPTVPTPRHTELDCSICLSTIDLDDRVRRVPCSHHHHAKCLDQWILKASTEPRCPVCRAPLLESDSSAVYRF